MKKKLLKATYIIWAIILILLATSSFAQTTSNLDITARTVTAGRKVATDSITGELITNEIGVGSVVNFWKNVNLFDSLFVDVIHSPDSITLDSPKTYVTGKLITQGGFNAGIAGIDSVVIATDSVISFNVFTNPFNELYYGTLSEDYGVLFGYRNVATGQSDWMRIDSTKIELKRKLGTDSTALTIDDNFTFVGGALSICGNIGSTPEHSSGANLLWIPDKAAFRAGYIDPFGDTLVWDADSVGLYSFAVGFQTKASGDYSTATGLNTTASRDGSTAMGNGTTASGTFSTAIGESSIASGASSIATGGSTTASGDYSTATGIYSTASGSASTAIGNTTTANSSHSFVAGSANTIDTASDGSFCIGQNNLIDSATYSSILAGQNNILRGNDTNPVENSSIISGNNITNERTNTAKGQDLWTVGYTISTFSNTTLVAAADTSLTLTQSRMKIISNEAGDVSLDTIIDGGLPEGTELMLVCTDDAKTVTVTTGCNIDIGAVPFTMGARDVLALIKVGEYWIEMYRKDN